MRRKVLPVILAFFVAVFVWQATSYLSGAGPRDDAPSPSARTSESAAPAPAEHPVVLIGEDVGSHMLAYVEGVLSDAGGCLGIGDTPVVWPEGTTLATRSGRLQLTYEGKTYRIGDTIGMGGGFVTPAQLRTFLKSAPEACNTAKSFWVV
jgi:hypothetical protein